jgi:hypothetical protein
VLAARSAEADWCGERGSSIRVGVGELGPPVSCCACSVSILAATGSSEGEATCGARGRWDSDVDGGSAGISPLPLLDCVGIGGTTAADATEEGTMVVSSFLCGSAPLLG